MKKPKKDITKSRKIFLLLRGIVFLILIRNILTGNYENVFVCILTLLLFLVPFIIERKFKIEIPDDLEIIILVQMIWK